MATIDDLREAAAALGVLMLLVTSHAATAQTTIILPTRPAQPKPSAAPVPDSMIVPPFEKLPDGRIGVEIFGQRIALPGTDDYLDRIKFLPLRQTALWQVQNNIHIAAGIG